MNQDIESSKSFDFIFNTLDSLNIPLEYLKKVTFDNASKSKSIYMYEERKIILNLSEIKACAYFGFINKQEMVLSFFNLLMHEIAHVIQKIYKENCNDDISGILKTAENLKFLSNNDYNLYYLFSDEIHANINAASFLYNFGKKNKLTDNYNYLEKSFVYYLTLGVISENIIINSQLKYLYNLLLGIDFQENYESLNEKDCIYLGLTKSKISMDSIIKSYQTQKLCIDIDGEGGLEYDRRNKPKKLCRFYEQNASSN